MSVSNFDVFCFTETWLNDTVFNNEIIPIGYSIYRKDRSARGGGVLIAVNDNIPSWSVKSPSHLEVTSVALQLDKVIIISTVYVPPNAPMSCMQSLCTYLACLSSENSSLVVVGDFNLPDIDWPALQGSCPASNLFCNTVFECNLIQFIDEPTHIKGNTLDLVLSNDSNLFVSVKVHPESDNPFPTDHFMISCGLQGSAPGPRCPCGPSSLVYDYPKANWDGMCSYLLDQDFSLCFEEEDVEAVWAVIRGNVVSAMELFIPKVRLRSRQFPRWYNKDLRHQQKCLESLRKRCERSPTLTSHCKLSEADLAFRSHAERVKSSYESGLISTLATGQSKAIYQYIRELRGGSAIPPTLFMGSLSATSGSEKVTLFNRYFHSVFTDSNFQLPILNSHNVESSIQSGIEFSESDVYSQLASLDVTKAKGLDGIGPSVLKFCSLALCEPLCHLFQLSVNQHRIPAEWKLHAITPIHKSGDKSLVSNYRPISLLSSTSKVLEKLIYARLLLQLKDKLSSVQFGFRRDHSTVQQLLLFYNRIFGGDDSRQWDIVYLDFSKAFDSVPHNELLLKLHRLGVSGDLWLWLQCYLSGRSQCVCVEGSKSTVLPVLSGVPQGSVLGPLLFLVFVNDLPDMVKESVFYMFADDVKCARPVCGVSDCALLQSDLDSLCSWSTEWKLLFKESKCVHLKCCSFRTDSVDFQYSLNNKDLQSKEKYKDLGVFISSDMTFSTHYMHITSRAYRVLGLLRRTFSSSAYVGEKRLLYISLVRSQLLYCSVLWRPFLKKDIELLERVQRRATKYILNDFRSDYKSRLISLDLLPLMYTYELQDIMFIVSHLKAPSKDFDLSELILFSSQRTRSSQGTKMIHRRNNTNLSRHNFFNRIPRLWNSLPPIDLDQSLGFIKCFVQAYLLDQFLTNFDANNSCSFHFRCPCSKCGHFCHPPTF